MTTTPTGGDERGRPLVAPPFVPVVVDPDTVQFRIGPWAGPAYTVRDDDGDGTIEELVRMLDGRRTREEILDAFEPDDREQVAAVLDRLAEEDVLVDAMGEADTLPPSDLPPTGVIPPRRSFTVEDTETVAHSTVLVVNVGPIGRFVAEDLVSAGARNVRLLEPVGRGGADDDDSPEGCSLLSPDVDLSSAVADADCVVYSSTVPHPELATQVNEAAFESSVPWVSGRLCGLDGFVGPAVIPGRTSCHECFRARFLGNVDDVRAYRQFERAAREDGGGRRSVQALSRIVAGYVTVDLLHLLLDGIGFTAGSVVHFDFFDLSVESNSVLKRPRCPVCGQSDREAIGRQRHLGLDTLVED